MYEYNTENCIMNDERVPIEVLEQFKEYYNSQAGRKYPCSNQQVICGIVTNDRDKAMNFMADKNVFEKTERKDSIVWFTDDGEKWVWRRWDSSCRSYRFYKIAIDASIDNDLFDCIIAPYCFLYCCHVDII